MDLHLSFLFIYLFIFDLFIYLDIYIVDVTAYLNAEIYLTKSTVIKAVPETSSVVMVQYLNYQCDKSRIRNYGKKM